MADDDTSGDDPEEEPIEPVPDALVHFGEDKFTAKEKHAALPEITMAALGAIKAICLRIQNQTATREDGYCLKILSSNAIFDHPDTLAARIKLLGLKTVEKTKGRNAGLYRDDPLKAITGVVKPNP